MINCKHCVVQGNTTKYYFCKIKGKAIDEINCRDCMLKIESIPTVVEELFKGFKK